VAVAVLGLAVALSGFVAPPLLHRRHAEPAKHEKSPPPGHSDAGHHGTLRLPPDSGWDLPARS
jgi:hypothetical protein